MGSPLPYDGDVQMIDRTSVRAYQQAAVAEGEGKITVLAIPEAILAVATRCNGMGDARHEAVVEPAGSWRSD